MHLYLIIRLPLRRFKKQENLIMQNLNKKLIPWIGRTAKMMEMVMTDNFLQHGLDLTKNQWMLLRRLVEKNGQIQKELAFITGRDKTSLGRLVTTMERKGFIIRSSMESDKRTKQIFITESGREAYLNALPLVKSLIQEVEEGIPQENLKIVIETLKQVQNNIKQICDSRSVGSENCYK
jgi:DNA-binding MarR family transcriptional regulator